nr:structure-specific recognition protein 1 [Theileria orientalis]
MASEVLDVDRKEVKRTGKLTVSRKRAAVELGYYEDEFVHVFGETYNQIPIVSLTYVHRVFSSRMISDLFVESFNGKPVQFVNLGGGLDTLCFYLLKKHPNVICFDTDLETQVKLKCELMAGHQIFTDLLPDLKLENGFYSSSRYKMFPLDLTRIEDFQRLLDAGFSKDLPTMYIAEFSSMYVEAEPMNKHFVSNSLGCAVYRTLESQIKRYEDLSWKLKLVSYNDFYNHNFETEEKKRILKLEDFKEMDELGTACSHMISGLCYKSDRNLSKVLNLFRTYDNHTNLNYYDMPYGINFAKPDFDDQLTAA